MPLLLGEGGTGKSTVLAVVAAMYSEDSLAEVDGNNESTFGFQDKYDKEAVFITDCPQHISHVLPQEMFQKMVSGERVQISVKHGMAFTVAWQPHIIAASNCMLDYRDNAGQASRRIVVFLFGRPVDAATADAGLEARIKSTELPNVVARCLGAYERMLAAVGGGSFWSACPAALRDAQEDAMAEGNLVYQFLVAGPDDSSSLRTRHFVRQIPGAVTEWPALKSAFDAYVRYKHPGRSWTLSTKEVGPFLKLGYEVVQDNMCCACGQRALSGCCPNYSKANRSKRWRVRHMELVREARVEQPQQQGEDPLGD
jgi:phage/plasmid-associated DNA primase